MKTTGTALTVGTLLAIILLPCTSLWAHTHPARPFPQHARYAPGTISPKFSRQSLDDDVRSFYDLWKNQYLVRAGTATDGSPLYRVSYGSVNPARTVSEGQGYGMMIVAIMAGHDPNAQTFLNGLWKFARLHPSSVDNRLMAWEVPENPDTGIDAAFDGDADMAHALFLADVQWGSTGKINYRQEGEKLLRAIAQSMIGPDSHLPMLGDWISREGAPYGQYTPRSSDFMPDHFYSWYRLTGKSLWKKVTDSTRQTISSFQQNHSPLTGLLPDFLVPASSTDHRLQPAPAHFLEGPHDGHYEYNAGRDPWRIGTDALLNNDPQSRAQTEKIADWVVSATGGKPGQIKNGYSLSGSPLNPEDDFTTFFAAPFGVAMMLRPANQAYLDKLYRLVRNRHEDYYEDSVNLLCLLVMTGNYWDPASSFPSGRVIPATHYLLLK